MPSWITSAKKFIQNITRVFRENVPGWPDWDEALEDSIEEAREIVMRHIEAWQPYGEQEPAIKFYNKYGQLVWERPKKFPSQRTGHTPISEGWFWETEREGRTLRLKIGNESQHFWAAVGDPEDYKAEWQVPGPLVFWWGPPLKWAPTTPWATNVDPPQFVLPWVWRQPPKYNPFWKRAMEDAIPEVDAVIQEGMGAFLIEIFQRQGYRHK